MQSCLHADDIHGEPVWVGRPIAGIGFLCRSVSLRSSLSSASENFSLRSFHQIDLPLLFAVLQPQQNESVREPLAIYFPEQDRRVRRPSWRNGRSEVQAAIVTRIRVNDRYAVAPRLCSPGHPALAPLR